MKHIITYKLFESSESLEEIKQYLKDIFQEMIDRGFHIDIWSNQYGYIHVYINKIVCRNSNGEDEYVDYSHSELDEYAESAIDYMKSIGFKYYLRKNNKGSENQKTTQHTDLSFHKKLKPI